MSHRHIRLPYLCGYHSGFLRYKWVSLVTAAGGEEIQGQAGRGSGTAAIAKGINVSQSQLTGSLRTLTGAQHFAAIRSYTATAGKNNINIYQALIQLAEGNAWLPPAT